MKLKNTLKNEDEIAEFLLETAGNDSDEEFLEEFVHENFKNYYGRLLDVAIEKIITPNLENHLESPKKQKKFNRMNVEDFPPIVIDEHYEVIDGHHRLRAHKYNNQSSIKCYQLLPKETLN